MVSNNLVYPFRTKLQTLAKAGLDLISERNISLIILLRTPKIFTLLTLVFPGPSSW